ncbi:hypothetical protein Pla108_19090 [Botrimarina colliarenosi]|uniref:Amylopullulanase X25 domain-containing protein n=1 Tax=Botrimarina colliarenosi TaxID=2528001 RepID=A0A5C6AEB9_9BACT|nr:hypothetical protein [Botrimarina colliarenosi]TWT97757.1 hypothetical protein Pla108_19090 [Botrimarina colliarenosi]
MLTRSFFTTAALAAGVLFTAVDETQALDLYAPGGYTLTAGLGADWTPATAPMLTESSPGSGIYELDFDLDYATNGNLSGTSYGFKILSNVNGGAVEWSDVQLTPNDAWFVADADGQMTIRINTNAAIDDGYFPNTNRVAILDDVSTWTAIGNFQTQLGSATDYNNAFAGTEMLLTSPGVYSLTTTIPTAGAYNWRAVNTGTFDGVGTDGRWNNAANLSFNTFENDQEITLEINTNIGGIRYLTEAVLAGDTDNNGVVEFADFEPIRDNFLTATSLRSMGDLDFSGFVDIRDFREWKNAINSPALVAQALAQLQAVPEPTAILMAGVAVALVGGTRRRVG